TPAVPTAGDRRLEKGRPGCSGGFSRRSPVVAGGFPGPERVRAPERDSPEPAGDFVPRETPWVVECGRPQLVRRARGPDPRDPPVAGGDAEHVHPDLALDDRGQPRDDDEHLPEHGPSGPLRVRPSERRLRPLRALLLIGLPPGGNLTG